jgi:hypothetical protein
MEGLQFVRRLGDDAGSQEKLMFSLLPVLSLSSKIFVIFDRADEKEEEVAST